MNYVDEVIKAFDNWNKGRIVRIVEALEKEKKEAQVSEAQAVQQCMLLDHTIREQGDKIEKLKVLVEQLKRDYAEAVERDGT